MFLLVGIVLGGTFFSTRQEPKNKDIQIFQFDWKEEYTGNRIIEGYGRNTTDKSYAQIRITFDLYDNRNRNVGTTTAVTGEIRPNSLFKFRTHVESKKAIDAKVKEVLPIQARQEDFGVEDGER